MGKHERRGYLQAIQKRYRQSDRAANRTILNEFGEICGYTQVRDSLVDEKAWDGLPLPELAKLGKLPERLSIARYAKLSYPDPESKSDQENRVKMNALRSYRAFMVTILIDACNAGNLAYLIALGTEVLMS